MLHKLEHYGIGGIPLQLFKNYLTNRNQYVKLYDLKSNLLQIQTGVPQGSILGSLLFIFRERALFSILYVMPTTLHYFVH